MTGPLSGLRIVSLGGLGPAPLACMLLADNGAEVIRIERAAGISLDRGDTMLRSQQIAVVDLKSDSGIEKLLELLKTADGLIDPFRPGTLERLGLGPDRLHEVNPKLVIGRMTGWGQTGPLASCAGHDINYIALSGPLAAIGTEEQPVPPLPLIGDMGGGGMYLAFGLLAALIHAARTGEGQVIDCAMTEGSALLMTAFYELYGCGRWKDARQSNFLDGGAHFYNTYRTKDDRFVSIGSLEPQFYKLLRDKLGLDGAAYDDQMDQASWKDLKHRLEAIFVTKTRDDWCELLEMSDVCFAPVLSMAEAPEHPHAKARGSFVNLDGIVQPAPGPRYSITELCGPQSPRHVSLDDILCG